MLTITDMITQLETVLAAWKAAQATASSRPNVSTAQQLMEALADGAPDIFLADDPIDGTYRGVFRLTRPTTLHGSRQAILEPADPFEPTILVLANDSWCQGFTVRLGMADRECIVVGDVDATSAALQPAHVTLQDLAVEGTRDGGHRGIALHGRDLVVTRCQITGFWRRDQDSQGIWVHNGPGPFTITDNVIEASGENILFGGARLSIPNCVPSDAFIARNVLRKPEAYAGLQNKNAFELKNARRVIFTENTIEHFLPTLLHDALIQLTPRNQAGDAPWSTVEDIEISRNVMRTLAPGFAVNLLGTDNEPGKVSQRLRNVRILGNLFLTTAGFQVLGGVEGDLTIDHNTLPSITKKLFSFADLTDRANVLSPLTFTNNVLKGGQYPITGCHNEPFGTPSLTPYAQVRAWAGNVIEDPDRWPWPAGQEVLAKDELAALLDPQTRKVRTGTAGW